MSFGSLIIMAVLLYINMYVQFNSIYEKQKSSLKSLETNFSDEEILALVLAFHEGDRWPFSIQIQAVLCLHCF